MIKIKIPNNNLNEREYILDIIFHEFLGIEYELIIDNGELKTNDWVIELKNGNQLIINDIFFNKYPNDLEYLKLENIPTKMEFSKNVFIVENNIPIIYGTPKLTTINQKLKTITCGIDIFASSFFMLTRWEEYVNKSRDMHNRFPVDESLAFKNSFLDRPIVNEYVEMLWNMLEYLNIEQERKKQEFNLILTHDIDHIYKWDTPKKFFKHLVGDLVLRKSIKAFFSSIGYYMEVKRGKRKDPFDTFDYLMDISEKLSIKSYFFFMAEGLTRYDNNYVSSSKITQNLVKKIEKRGHYIGIHPTYNAYNRTEQLQKEKKELEVNFNTPIYVGREHYLRFEIPTTWQIWEDNNMAWDSSLGYADREGFRCGVCYEYSVFNILTRKKLKLKEKPLIVMEESVTRRENLSSENMESIIENLLIKVKKYKGDFVFLWHNSSFNTEFWNRYKKVYENVLLRNGYR